MRLGELWRRSPLLWVAGVILMTPLIVICGLLAVVATVAAGSLSAARAAAERQLPVDQASAAAAHGDLAPVVALETGIVSEPVADRALIRVA